MTTQLLGRPPKRLRSRAKARAGIEALRDEAKEQRAATGEAAQAVLKYLERSPDQGIAVRDLLEASDQPWRQAVDALQRLASEGRVAIDSRSAIVKLKGK